MCRDKGKDSEKGNHAATHLFNQESMCRGQGSGAEEVVRAATHLFARKNPYREHGEGEKKRTEATPHCTTRYDHPTKPHHIISHHITTISKPDNTTNRQNPIPCLKHHTPPHYTTKALPPKNWRKSFIGLSANRLS